MTGDIQFARTGNVNRTVRNDHVDSFQSDIGDIEIADYVEPMPTNDNDLYEDNYQTVYS